MIKIKKANKFTIPRVVPPGDQCELVTETDKLKSKYNLNRAGINNGTIKLKFYPSIYGHALILDELFVKTQKKKCCYCEKRDYRDGTTVDHYRPKKGFKRKRKTALVRPGYYWLAYDWSNLIYSCNTCNRNKGNLFPISNERSRVKNHRHRDYACLNEVPLIVNPSEENPEHYFSFNRERIIEKKLRDPIRLQKAKTTIDSLKLNRRKLVDDRRELFHKIDTYISRKIRNARTAIQKVSAMRQIKRYLVGKISSEQPFSLMIKSNFRKYLK